MNWPLFFMLGSLTLIAGIFVGLVYWANWDEITGKNRSQISRRSSDLNDFTLRP